MKLYLKQRSVFLIVCTLFILLMSVSENTDTAVSTLDNGAIGDTKFSILEPSEFMTLNPGWILMDGGASPVSDSIYKRSILWTKYQIPFPDARGVFLRAMNERRSVLEGDADGDSSVGRYQKDTFTLHKHRILIKDFAALNFSGGHHPPRADDQTGSTLVQGAPSVETGGSETRPRNISLYLYIKVR